MRKDLIIDVGMHTGKDTEFYLRKGFRVVAIEANPLLVKQVSERLAEQIEKQRLTIYNVAINDYDGQVEFFINCEHDDWGTLSRDFVARNERLGSHHERVTVECVRFERILEECGTPYYLKIDIEGSDMVCLKALHQVERKPQYVSIEAGLLNFEETFEELSHLWVLGYRQFKIVNQCRNPLIRCPNPPLEGKYVDVRFGGDMSGPFGEEAPGRWRTAEETFDRFKQILKEQALFGTSGKYYRTPLHRLVDGYRSITKHETIGWYDFHAKLGEGP